MVKVLENKLVDLDLMPGQEHIDAQRQFRTQMQQAKQATSHLELGAPSGAEAATEGAKDGEVELPEGSQVVEGQAGAKIAREQGFQIPKEMLPEHLSEEQRAQAKGFGGVIVDGSGKVISGLAGTVGGVLKGVGDTAGNTVYGLGQIPVTLVTGLADTAKAPFAGKDKASQPTTAAPAEEIVPEEEVPKREEVRPGEEIAETAEPAGAAAERKKPRKIEVRSGKPVEVDADGNAVEDADANAEGDTPAAAA